MVNSIFKKVGLTLLSIVLAYNSYKLIDFLLHFSMEEFTSVGHIVSAVAINLLVTGVFAFLGFAWPTHRLVPESYYRIKNKKQLLKLYAVLGVKFFKMFLLMTFYRRKDNKKYFNGTKSGIMAFDYNTRQSEFGHLAAFIVIEIIAIIFLVNSYFELFLWIQPINIFFNMYPIILQRFHRIKTEKLRSRLT